MSVKVENITKRYGRQIAVNDISFEVNRGQILGFLGPNGAGKSTTMKIIAGFITSDDGRVDICGHDVENNPIEIKRKIGYLPESNPLYGDMYVSEYLKFVGTFYKIADIKSRVTEIIEMTGLGPERHKQISQLSKGYKQRVGLAQAIIHDPDVLILDEPTSGLDPNQLVEIRTLIRNLGNDKTVIFSSHIMQEVQAICDRVVIIDKGNIVANDDIKLLQNSVNKERSVIVEYEAPFDKNVLSSLQGVSRVEVDGSVYEIWSKSDMDVRPVLFDLAVEHNIRILEMKQSKASVEEIFKAITN